VNATVIPSRQLVELVDPQAARVASMLRAVVGQPAVVVSRFELVEDGSVLQATPAELDQVLEGLRAHSSEAPEVVLARYARRLREAFHT
jgi:hypothetical protein